MSADIAVAVAAQARALTDRIKAGFAETERLRELQSLMPAVTQPVRRDTRSVYFIQASTGAIKIGVTRDVNGRLATLRTMSPVPLTLLGSIPAVGQQHEADLHDRFAAHRSHGEWFHPAPELLNHIRENA